MNSGSVAIAEASCLNVSFSPVLIIRIQGSVRSELRVWEGREPEFIRQPGWDVLYTSEEENSVG